jgi:hypothetical protein
VVNSEGREASTLAELLRRLADLPPADAVRILARATPAPLHPAAETGELPPPPRYASWDDFLTRTTLAERRRWCAQKAGKANRERLMSGRPEIKITTEQVWTVLEAAQGRCHHCGSLAVERRPSAANGAPLPWNLLGRRVGSLGHLLSRFHGGSNTWTTWSGHVCGATPGRPNAHPAPPTTAHTTLETAEAREPVNRPADMIHSPLVPP